VAVADLSSPPRLEALLAVTRLVRADVPRLELVEAVAAAIATSLAFGTVVVNLRRAGTGDFVVAAVHGSPEARGALMGTTSTWEDWAPVLEERFATAGAYFVPAGAFEWPTGPPAHVPDLAMLDDAQGWDGEDALFAPLTDTSGGLLGVISVDEPITGRKPSEEDLALLAGFCAHLGAALELADLGAAHGARTRALERLARTSVAALGTLDLDAALAEACAAVAEGLGFERVEVALIDRDRLVTRGRFGTEHWLDGLAPEEVEGALGEELSARLSDPDGGLAGYLRAAGPLPISLPDVERRRLLRTFASQIEARLSSAEHRAAVESEARKTAMLEASLDAIVTVAADRTVLEFNPAAERIFGYRRDEAVGRDVTGLLLPPAQRDDHRRLHDQVLALEPGQGAIDHRFETPAMRADGTTFPSEIAVVRIELDGPPLLTAFVRDISDRVAARRALEGERDQARHAALHDPVTGLRNRSGALAHVSERMPSVAAEGGVLLAVGLELDGLDLINQSLGYAHGDELLRAVGQRLSRSGWLVAHTGRREFLVLVACADPSPAVADAIARDIAATIDRPFAVKGLELQVGAVVGHAVLAEADAPPEDLLRRVDVASHQARAGGAITAYDADADVSHRTLTRLSALHGALDRSELELHYQPITACAVIAAWWASRPCCAGGTTAS
jgi:PAS domain S-box-containing protein/diguanylate cyclase (GGDEF)-like protein